MNEAKPETADHIGAGIVVSTIRKLRKFVFISNAIIIFEALWSRLVALLSIIGLFFIYALSGLPEYLSAFGKISILCIFGILIIWIARSIFSITRPNAKHAIRRIDRDSGSPHRAVQTILDKSTHSLSRAGHTLWISNLLKRIATPRLFVFSLEKSNLPRRDPFALRFQIWILVFALGLIGSGQLKSDLFNAFTFDLLSIENNATPIEGWINPPPYTGIPPIIISLDKSARNGIVHFSAPINSTLVIKNSDNHLMIRNDQNGVTSSKARDQLLRGDYQADLIANSFLRIDQDGSDLVELDIRIIPDRAPTIEIKDIQYLETEKVMVSYTVDDDYPVQHGELRIVSTSSPIRGGQKTKKSLVTEPVFELSMPTGRSNHDAELIIETSRTPRAWAGAKVRAILFVKDQSGQESYSKEFTLTLPERRFRNPLARSLAELGQTLLLEPDLKSDIDKDLQAIVSNPSLFEIDYGSYLSLRSISRNIHVATGDDQLLEAGLDLDRLALALEESQGNLVESELQGALDALRDELNSGNPSRNSPDLMNQLKRALGQYLKELGSKQKSAREPKLENQRQKNKNIKSDDLMSMLEKLEQFQKNGELAEAKRLLDQLRDILQALQSADSTPSDPQSEDFSSLLDDLDRMTRSQQDLRDQNFRRGRGKDESESGQADQGQEKLSEDLQNLMEQLQSYGVPKLESLEQALEAMRSAGRLSKQGGGKGLIDDQNRALKGLRQGKQELSDLLQNTDKNNAGGPPRNGLNGKSISSRSKNNDPQGSAKGELDEFGNDTVNKSGTTNGARMRSEEVLKELGRKLGESGRPPSEKDYFQRLLELN